MYEVKIRDIKKVENKFHVKHVSFNCDSFEEYEFTYKFNFGPIGCMWSQNLCKSLVKSITKI